ncbi:MAG: hypothetical protein D8M59_12210 [Planctomycetes bacterium]|nr:hypothetical protein [Planctomycetota bacterium]NOG53571.1 hypothetical protein [Planctomycetota bacterium]
MPSQTQAEHLKKRRDPTRTVAGILAIGAFTVALLAGLPTGNSIEQVIVRAIICLFASYPVGLLIGYLGTKAIQSEMEQYIASHPIPDSNISLNDMIDQIQSEQSATQDQPEKIDRQSSVSHDSPLQ